jgi:uncharacterized protein
MRAMWLLALPLAGALAACPGTSQNFDLPKQDAEPGPPDGAVEAEAGPPEPVKVMNWNTRNFFDDKLDSPEFDGGCAPNQTAFCETLASPAEYQTKLGQVSSVISTIAPDIAILEEVENMPVAIDLAEKVGGYPYRHVTQGNDPRGINIAVLSKIEFQISPSHKSEKFSASTDPNQQQFEYSRDLLEIHFLVNTRHLVLLGVHFKAQDSDPVSDTKRLAEAEHTRSIALGILANDPTASVIVLGDFNCTPGSPPMDALAGTTDPPFASATAGLAPNYRYSVDYAGNPQLYDDQQMSPLAASWLDAASVGIVHNNGDANSASDHDPVYASYVVQ